MREPTVALQGSPSAMPLASAGSSATWTAFVVGHGGSANGQFAELLLVPERNFAVVSLSNLDRVVSPLIRLSFVGLFRPIWESTSEGLEPLAYDEARAREVVGSYRESSMTLTIGTDGSVLRLDVRIKPEIRAAAKTEPPPDLRLPTSVCCRATRMDTWSRTAV